jgi:hypothetical protein
MTTPLVPHPWDEDEERLLLDQIKAKWDEASGLRTQADEFRDMAHNADTMADEADEAADALSEQVLAHRPQWREALILDQVDPRTLSAE